MPSALIFKEFRLLPAGSLDPLPGYGSGARCMGGFANLGGAAIGGAARVGRQA